MKDTYLILIFCLLLASCGPEKRPVNTKRSERETDPKLLMSNVKICDDCVSSLRVSYHEYTGSLDFAVDTGTVYISSKLFKSMTDILNLDSSMTRPINTIDFLFADHNDFEKLWPTEGRYMSGSKYDGGWKDYTITGRVCGFNYHKREYWNRWQLELVFCMKDFKVVPGTGDNFDRSKRPKPLTAH